MLTTPLYQLLKTTKFHLKRLEELGILTVEDFLTYFPHRYTDQREVARIIDVVPDELMTIRGKVTSIHNKAGFRGRMSIITALITDTSGTIEAVWFNQAFLAQKLKQGTEVMLAGKAKYDPKKHKLSFRSPVVEVFGGQPIHTARIVPVYHETELNTTKKVPGKISSKWIREKLFPLLNFAEDFKEFLPVDIIKKHKLIQLPQAIRGAHFPKNEKELEQAQKRLSFDELFLLQLGAMYRRHQWRKTASQNLKQIKPDWELIKEFTSSLPYSLTNAQKKALYEILKDLENPFPMSRLLEGDTGSGKTIVAAAAALQTIRGGYQVALLAPTEILARQHFKTFEKVLKTFDIKPILLVGSTPEKEKKEAVEALKKGKISLVIGTHALIQQHIAWKNLGLAIIDEQHRFGVKQRELLKTHGSPHILHLSATPIPRTLALIIYGDQDLSVLDEMPPGRQKILTRIVPEEKRAEAYTWMQKEIEQGRQAFIIFPLIEESEVLQIKAATKEFDTLQNAIFPKLKLGLLHGQMPAKEKDETMQKFAVGKTDILVSTAVVEVGVDVPNATIMMIEGAERFGLAQLHQFRGRVGRGSEKSYCLLFPSSIGSTSSSSDSSRTRPLGSSQNPLVLKRLNALEQHDSGFKLADIDLQLRGPGEVYGTAQSGIPDLKMASLTDALTIKLAHEAAENLIAKDPELNSYALLKERILSQQENIAIDY